MVVLEIYCLNCLIYLSEIYLNIHGVKITYIYLHNYELLFTISGMRSMTNL